MRTDNIYHSAYCRRKRQRGIVLSKCNLDCHNFLYECGKYVCRTNQMMRIKKRPNYRYKKEYRRGTLKPIHVLNMTEVKEIMESNQK
jgi:hypothetical protein